MNALVFHVCGGDAFFSGIALLLAAALTTPFRSAAFRRLRGLVGLVGVLFAAASSTPVPFWYYGVAAAATVVWTMTGNARAAIRRTATAAFVGVWLGAAVLELRYRFPPPLAKAPTRTLTVIGDSVTAGMGGEDRSERWPQILARLHDVEVQDLSHMGETAESALKRHADTPIRGAVVLVEIGGNDVLGTTTPTAFRMALERLLGKVCELGLQTAMFELPLPPFFHEYGRIQRELAAKYRVTLIPKRTFLAALAQGGATLDSIHLSQTGHQYMANVVWSVVEPAFGKSPP